MTLQEQVARAYEEGGPDAAIAVVLKDAEVTYEVWEDDLLVASSTSQADALHYLHVYSQDGPVVLKTSFTVRLDGIRSAFASENNVEVGE